LKKKQIGAPGAPVRKKHMTPARHPLRWFKNAKKRHLLRAQFFCSSGIKENAVRLALALTPQELQTSDAAHPPPGR
jgi:hypothetical protein